MHKGHNNSILVDGKTLNQIAEETGIKLATVQHRYSRGKRDMDSLTKRIPKNIYSNVPGSQKVLNELWKQDITITDLAKRSGVSRTSIYNFLFNANDISAVRLAKICKVIGISMDEVMSARI